MRLQTCIKIGSGIGLIALLAACGSSGQPVGTPRNTTTQTFEAEIGAGFATLFDASTTSQPATPTDSSLPPLQPAAQPQVQPSTT